MTHNLENSSITERFEHLVRIASGERFRNMQGLGKEVPFYVCPFEQEESVAMSKMVKQLANKLRQSDLRILQVDLYSVCVDLLKERGRWKDMLNCEQTTKRSTFYKQLLNYVDSEAHLIPAVSRIMNSTEFDVMFIVGIGEVFPFVRSHNMLNNLQRIPITRPIIMFFPGQYIQTPDRGAFLKLFGRLQDKNYYRAFNIYHLES